MKNTTGNPIQTRATITIATTLGILIGICGVIHGFFEALQGYQSTDGFFIFAVGKGNSWTLWTQGSEGAFTIVPNFLVTGLCAMIVGIALAVWSAFYNKAKKGSLVFILVGICLFLVGGGVAQVPFIVLTAAIITRINKPLNWWQNNIPKKLRRILTKLWFWLLISFLVLFATAFEVSIFGFFPFINDPNTLLMICWFTLGFATVLLLLSIIGAFSFDKERRRLKLS